MEILGYSLGFLSINGLELIDHWQFGSGSEMRRLLVVIIARPRRDHWVIILNHAFQRTFVLLLNQDRSVFGEQGVFLGVKKPR